jgi:hypothetical protein
MIRVAANDLDLGPGWNKVKIIANEKKLSLYLVNTYLKIAPTVERWEEMHLELGDIDIDQALDLVCDLRTMGGPDEMRYVKIDGKRRLELWWD